MITKHFVTFYSPGSFVAEMNTQPIASWDPTLAQKMASPNHYGFRFFTKGRTDLELDSKEIASSRMYYVNSIVETLEEVVARNDPSERILRENMECNEWKAIVRTNMGKGWCQPLYDGDVVL